MKDYSKKEIRRAGESLINSAGSPNSDDKLKINYWRTIHQYPLQRLFDDSKKYLIEENDFCVAGRIKKFDTILDKLRRSTSKGNITSMHDIAGCRIIVPDMQALNVVSNKALKLESCDEAKTLKRDYILNPKPSGYRGRHVICRYPSQDERHASLWIELQLRTRLQHAWSTAVEMYDFATSSRLKFDEFHNDSGKFFQAASKIIEDVEFNSIETNKAAQEAIKTIQALEEVSSIIENLEACLCASTILGDTDSLSFSDYCLVDVTIDEQSITLEALGSDNAISTYFVREINSGNNHNLLLVLMNKEGLDELKALYPNYFGDISTFLNLIKKKCNL